jgi:hypothetical protein
MTDVPGLHIGRYCNIFGGERDVQDCTDSGQCVQTLIAHDWRAAFDECPLIATARIAGPTVCGCLS